jgi:membrane protein DedA with SNARE-associated domain
MTNLPSSQIIYLTLGYLVNTATFNVAIAILLGALANTIGNLILYYLILNNSDFLNSKLAKILNINNDLLNQYNEYFKTRGWGWLIIGKVTPSVKVLVPVICGLARIPLGKTLTIFSLGSLIWACAVTFLGFYFGKNASLLEFYISVTLIYILIGTYSYIRVKYNKK